MRDWEADREAGWEREPEAVGGGWGLVAGMCGPRCTAPPHTWCTYTWLNHMPYLLGLPTWLNKMV